MGVELTGLKGSMPGAFSAATAWAQVTRWISAVASTPNRTCWSIIVPSLASIPFGGLEGGAGSVRG